MPSFKMILLARFVSFLTYKNSFYSNIYQQRYGKPHLSWQFTLSYQNLHLHNISLARKEKRGGSHPSLNIWKVGVWEKPKAVINIAKPKAWLFSDGFRENHFQTILMVGDKNSTRKAP